MKKFIFFICTLLLSLLIVYAIGRAMADTADITNWSSNGQNYFTAFVITFTMFGTLWMSEQPWAQKENIKVTFRIHIAKVYIYKYWQLIRQPK